MTVSKNNYEKRKERAGKLWYPWGGSGGGASRLETGGAGGSGTVIVYYPV